MAPRRGYVVYRHQGRYFTTYYDTADSRFSVLGWRTMSQIPRNTAELIVWCNEVRLGLEEQDDATPDSRRAVQPREAIFIEHIYEIDLDNLIFHINCMPFFPLKNLPPSLETLLTLLEVDSYGFWNYAPSAALDYKYDVSASPPPPVDGLFHRAYFSEFGEGKVEPVHDLLGVNEHPGACDTICLRMQEILVGCFVREFGDVIVQHVGLARNRDAISATGQEMALLLAAMVLLPPHLIHKNYDAARLRTRGPYWWLRKHICVLLSTHLHCEENMRAAVAEITEVILNTTNTPQLVYGVVFSIFHCVIVRVDRTAGSPSQHTPVLQFLPSFYATSPTTPGITALVRLGNLRANDDISFFYRLLSTLTAWQFRVDTAFDKADPIPLKLKRTAVNRKPFRLLDLPLELISCIAAYIDDGDDLINLSRTSKETMAAIIPALRRPQVNAWDNRSGFVHRSVLHSYFGELDRPPAPHRKFSGNACMFSGRFETVFEGHTVVCNMVPCSLDIRPRAYDNDIDYSSPSDPLLAPEQLRRTARTAMPKGLIRFEPWSRRDPDICVGFPAYAFHLSWP